MVKSMVAFRIKSVAATTSSLLLLPFFMSMNQKRSWKVLCWNVRGVNSEDKWDPIRDTVRDACCDIFCFQETKRQHFDSNFIKNLCTPDFDSFAYLPSIGASGGLLICWKSRFFEGQKVFQNQCNINEMLLFNDAISALGLIELPLFGKKYTWTNKQSSPLLERLDWFFSSSAWTTYYPNTTVSTLLLEILDHWPCNISISTSIPKGQLFRFENHWLHMPSFPQVAQ